MKKSLVLFVGLLITTCHIWAQSTGTIKGFVYDKETGEPMIFTTVFLEGTNYGTNTDVNGYFQLTKIPAGKYILKTTFVGYDTAQATITIKGGDVITQKLFLSPGIQLNTYQVDAEREEFKTQVKISVQKITPKEITSIPSVGGEPDLAQYLQVLPGVIFTGDQGGQLFIRGGSMIQNRLTLDGAIIYNPFHSIGLFSVIDAELIRNADIYTGGFGAKYGGRISSVMDITTKDGNKKKHTGIVSANTFGAKVLLEGPIKKQKEDNTNSSSISYIVSAKNSYLDKSSKIFYNYVDSAGLPYSFTDLYGKISFNSNSGNKLSVFGFHYDDNVNYRHISNINWSSNGAGTNFVLIPGSSKTLIDGVFAYSDYKIKQNEGLPTERSSKISGFNFGLNFTYFSGDNESKYGFEVVGTSTDFRYYNSVGRLIFETQNNTELHGFYTIRISKPKYVLEPGIRMIYYSSLSTASPEPRLAFKYKVTNNFRFKTASGFYSQNLITGRSNRDVVNLFYSFLSSPQSFQTKFTLPDGTVKDVNHKLQKAIHLIAGFEYDWGRYVTLNVEGYYNIFTQLIDINRNKLYDDNADNAAQPEIYKKNFLVENGKAYGIDFSGKYEKNQLSINLVYSLTKVTRWDGLTEYFPFYDRRHNLNFTTAYKFGKGYNWEFNLRWNLGSGFPFTQTAGVFENLTLQSGLDQPIVSQNGEPKFIYAEYNAARLPYYHRLDITVKRTFALGKNSTLETNLSIINVYNRENIFYYDRVLNQRINQLPILPAIGLSWKF
ncbi:MAG: TonB-dependent receptor [Vicingaceae bacterium]|nr:MAG: TonB-dependent receptor [Vicingaceae bacterium]